MPGSERFHFRVLRYCVGIHFMEEPRLARTRTHLDEEELRQAEERGTHLDTQRLDLLYFCCHRLIEFSGIQRRKGGSFNEGISGSEWIRPARYEPSSEAKSVWLGTSNTREPVLNGSLRPREAMACSK